MSEVTKCKLVYIRSSDIGSIKHVGLLRYENDAWDCVKLVEVEKNAIPFSILNLFAHLIDLGYSPMRHEECHSLDEFWDKCDKRLNKPFGVGDLVRVISNNASSIGHCFTTGTIGEVIEIDIFDKSILVVSKTVSDGDIRQWVSMSDVELLYSSL